MNRDKVSILLVEDNAGDARLIREMLKETEYAQTPFRHAASLSEALNTVTEKGITVSVLLDLFLPDSQGIGTLQRIRNVFSDSAIVVLTGLHDEQLALDALKEGAQNYLTKDDLDARTLGRMLRQSIERHGFMSRLREADREMVFRERRFRALVEHSSDMTLLMDASGNLTYTSPKAARTFGVDNHGDGGVNIASLLDPLDADTAHACLHAAVMQPERPFPIVARSLMMNGGQFWMEGTITNLLDVPGVFSIVANLHDITSRRKADEELQRANAELEFRVDLRTAELRRAERGLREALKAERELNDMKSRFVSMASHEFRTPLTSIMNSADLIARHAIGAGVEGIDRNVGRIRNKVRELTGILNEFLSLEKLEQGLEQVEPRDFDLVNACTDLAEELKAMAKTGQEIVYTHRGKDRMIRSDQQMLASVLRNLLSNAIKYSHEGARIVMTSTSTEERVRIEVIDKGIGIPEEDQSYLFGRFFRAGNAATVQGTGLGLHIVRRYVEMMQGAITFVSRTGEGSTFSIDLPRAMVAQGVPPATL